MIAEILKSMLPPDFDLDAALKQFTAAIVRMNQSADKIDELAVLFSKQKAVIDEMALKIPEPEPREIKAWRVDSAVDNESFVALTSPEGMITPEDIAEKQLSIYPLFK